mgnify:CR=1 FL=1
MIYTYFRIKLKIIDLELILLKRILTIKKLVHPVVCRLTVMLQIACNISF